MSEFRRDPTTGRWAIIAPERGSRPFAQATEAPQSRAAAASRCPFCLGNEVLTPPEVYRDPSDGPWAVRVVPNKFPALTDQDDLGHNGEKGLFQRMAGAGAHEVVIETPDHCAEIPDLTLEHAARVVGAYIARIRHLMTNPRNRHVLLFKNHGEAGGASLHHAHSQIIASPIVPRDVCNSLEIARAYSEQEGHCLFCAVIEEEIRRADRIVNQDAEYVVLTPYASRVPYELVIYPKDHAPDFGSLDARQRLGFAQVLQRTLQRLRTLLGDVPYNLILETAPNPASPSETPKAWTAMSHAYHWHMRVVPRLAHTAGFEWGTGMHINPMPPKEAAASLRDVRLLGEAGTKTGP